MGGGRGSTNINSIYIRMHGCIMYGWMYEYAFIPTYSLNNKNLLLK